MALTYLTGNRILDQQFGAVAPTVPAIYYFALSTGSPVVSGSGFIEPTSGSYARVAVANDKATTWNNASANSVTNKVAVTFNQSTGSGWGTIAYVGIYDASTVGNLLYYSALSPSRVVAGGTTVYFDIGDITASIINV